MTGDGLVRVGVVGTGNIGTAHATTLARTVSGALVTVVHDKDATRAGSLASELGARTAGSAAEVFGADDTDAVLIASPDDAHAQQLLDGLPSGKPVLCEKPLAVDVAEAAAVLDAEVALDRRVVQLGFMRRFDPGYVDLKGELGAAGIGDPLIVHNIHRNTAAPYGLRTDETLTNMVVHEVDASRWLLDEELVSVLVLAGKPGPHTPAGESDPILVVAESESGVLVEVEAFRQARSGYEVTCRVTGTQGQAVMGDGAWVTRAKDFHRGVGIPQLWLGRFDEAYRRQLQAWVDAVRTGAALPGASVWDGYAAAVVANRAIESYRSSQRVAIDLPQRPALYA
jgi:myo-inositol 2-dehydrogenase/D-chiro-inositol 1-dehydrogenase